MERASYILLLTVITLVVIYVTRRKKVSEMRYKKPRKEKRECAVRHSFIAKPSVNAPFVLFNSLSVEDTEQVEENVVICENYYIVSGRVGVFRDAELIGSLSHGNIILAGLELLGVKTHLTRKTLEQCLLVKLPDGDPKISLKILERTLINPFVSFFGFHYELLKSFEGNIFYESYTDFQSLYRESPKRLEIQKGEVYTIKGTCFWIEKGCVEIYGCIFSDKAFFGVLGILFDSTRNIFSAKALSNTVIHFLSVTSVIKREEPEFFIGLLSKCKVSSLISDCSALITWSRLYPRDCLFSAHTTCNEIHLVEDEVLCSSTALVGLPHTSNYVTKKIIDVITIPGVLIERTLSHNPQFARRFIRMSVPVKKERNKGSLVLITSAGSECIDFLNRIQRTLLSDCHVIRGRDLFWIAGGGKLEGCGELVVTEYLFELRKKNKIILLYLENEWSRILKLCAMACDVIYVVGRDIIPNKIERHDVEFVQLHKERSSSSKKKILKKIFFHDQCDESSSSDGESEENVDTSKSQRTRFPAYRRIHHILCPEDDGHCMKDFERLARYLRGERIGLVLGGGGARGLAHVGVIQALDEENIPIDCVGGTSMGAFVGALYARNLSFTDLYTKSRLFSKYCSSYFYVLLDITYPYVSLFSGRTFDWIIKAIFGNAKIESLWLDFYCITTDLLAYSECVRFSGTIRKWVRASMSICGYLPPCVIGGRHYVDGAYVNNVPVDVMKNMGVQTIIAVDVADDGDVYFDPYDSQSGLLLLFKRLFASKRYLSLQSLQYHLAFLSASLKRVKPDEVFLIKPKLANYRTSDFANFDEIVACGYEAAKAAIKRWRIESTVFKNRRYRGRRNSI